jgi:uncharacterized coiled-coil DUF342 family protein
MPFDELLDPLGLTGKMKKLDEVVDAVINALTGTLKEIRSMNEKLDELLENIRGMKDTMNEMRKELKQVRVEAETMAWKVEIMKDHTKELKDRLAKLL